MFRFISSLVATKTTIAKRQKRSCLTNTNLIKPKREIFWNLIHFHLLPLKDFSKKFWKKKYWNFILKSDFLFFTYSGFLLVCNLSTLISTSIWSEFFTLLAALWLKFPNFEQRRSGNFNFNEAHIKECSPTWNLL